MPKIFHDPHKNPAVLPPTYFMYGSLVSNQKETLFELSVDKQH